MTTITFVNLSDSRTAIRLLSRLPDDLLENKSFSATYLRNNGCNESAEEIERMSPGEYVDFVTNNVED